MLSPGGGIRWLLKIRNSDSTICALPLIIFLVNSDEFEFPLLPVICLYNKYFFIGPSLLYRMDPVYPERRV